MADYVPADDDYAYSNMDIDILAPANSPIQMSTIDPRPPSIELGTVVSPLTPRKRGHSHHITQESRMDQQNDQYTPKKVKTDEWFNPYGIDRFTLGHPCKELDERHKIYEDYKRAYPITRWHMGIDTAKVNWRQLDEKLRTDQILWSKGKRPRDRSLATGYAAKESLVTDHQQHNIAQDSNDTKQPPQNSQFLQKPHYLTIDDLAQPTEQQTVRVYLEMYIMVRKPHLVADSLTGSTIWQNPDIDEYALNLSELQKVLVMWLALRTGIYPLLKMSLEIPDLFEFVIGTDADFEEEFNEKELDCTLTFVREVRMGIKEVRDILHCEMFDPVNGQNRERHDVGGVDEVMAGVARDFLAECKRLARFLQKFKNLVGLKSGDADADLDTMLEDDDDNATVTTGAGDLCLDFLQVHSEEIRDLLLGMVSEENN